MSAAAPMVPKRSSPRPVESAAGSAWLRPLMEGPLRRVRVVGASGPACYVRVGETEMVAVETAGGARLPNALTVDGLAGLAVDADGMIGDGTLRIADRTVAIRRWWDPHPRVGVVDPAVLLRGRDHLPSTPPHEHQAFGLRAPIHRLHDAARRRDHHAVAAIVADLVGRGPGSTPAGDDVLAGLLATLRVCGDPSDTDAGRFADAVALHTARAAHRTTTLSATLLRCADDGAVVHAAGRVLRALAGHGDLDPAVGALAAVGHTSGRDLLTGITIAVDLLTTGRTRT
ncbi:hypothetical protein BH23ACT10_BH23ACT10_23760 [soil metagenome]